MASSQDPERRHTALDKALLGKRLLLSDDYQGAMAASTEAIELDPGLLDAYRVSTSPEAMYFMGSRSLAKIVETRHVTLSPPQADEGPGAVGLSCER